jgi:glycosyltransferase involved in cell wall biosynthesis
MSAPNVQAAADPGTPATTPARNLKILCYIPAYNAAATIPSVLDRIPESTKKLIDEYLVVDNASEDNTHLVGIGYAQQKGLTNLKVHRSEVNGGYGGSQKVGYRYAIDHGFDAVVMLHGDGQYAPERMEYLLEPIYQGKADHVFGSRITGDPRGGGMPLHRYLGNLFLTTIENWILGWNLSEYHSGYRIYTTEALKKIPFERCSNEYHFDSQILVQVRLAGLRVAERTIPTYYGSEKCYVPLMKYGMDVLKTMAEYLLHITNIRRSPYLELEGPIAKKATPAVRM